MSYAPIPTFSYQIILIAIITISMPLASFNCPYCDIQITLFETLSHMPVAIFTISNCPYCRHSDFLPPACTHVAFAAPAAAPESPLTMVASKLSVCCCTFFILCAFVLLSVLLYVLLFLCTFLHNCDQYGWILPVLFCAQILHRSHLFHM